MLTCVFEGKHTISVFSLTWNSWTTKGKWALGSHYSLTALTLCSFLKNKTVHTHVTQPELLVSSPPIFLSLSLSILLNCKSIVLVTPVKTLEISLTLHHFSKPEAKVAGSFFKYVTDLATYHNLPWEQLPNKPQDLDSCPWPHDGFIAKTQQLWSISFFP